METTERQLCINYARVLIQQVRYRKNNPGLRRYSFVLLELAAKARRAAFAMSALPPAPGSLF